MSRASLHVPVLLHEVLLWLDPRPGGLYVDATVGTGGHAEAILERILPGGRLVGLDRDPEALVVARERLERFGSAVQLVQANFADLQQVLRNLGIERVRGVLLDLGVSQLQLAAPHRGFSFRLPGPLDMRMDPTSPVTAADLVNRLPERELAELLRRYGEEPFAARIAREIVRRRPLSTTQELREAVLRAVPRSAWPRRVDVATRTFQALRIAVNRELEALERALPQAVEVLNPGGRLVVISFHSLEDRIVKHALRGAKHLRVLTPKPVRPSPEEVRRNPHARSARLRAAERIEP
ncbi:MAG: 16S rRNA (cytosine(1402)-N(4))-methyltransferase RsmH [Armatimonadota bacterium]|nr:16S rRNA (cytosine(1402)-N(4))-methyltransferase RsmH [Armatimonadota bacterium]MDR7439634.1 16S rRNA (cytosine(1402)-N(4))-methyltransferase RsmH [Armatimonadota bacterium]MDR7563673.1 16S rRNA (cytosine(1402)-N(4))-methyltransferase RsmH [Armatimonadota bacterium]MDR7566768.1 16S rRNA (cytosine(1402)-N(4))-methyltransferase RsmH [Armatimonadota bacterium]MDR7601296.1 16S rRNA (cytosine(1402)-N(4))-methyltransferase RsmH [Armatimonadota bacterium]